MSKRIPTSMSPRSRLTIIIFAIVIFTITLSLSKGSTSIPIYQLLFSENSEFTNIFWELRLPRTLTAFVSGGLLALAGVLMQLLLENPLADPYALGISGGAALFTLILMLLGVNESWWMAGSWIGSLFIMALIVLFAKKHRWQTHTLLLTGISLACGLSASISFILLLTPNTDLHGMLFWLTGDLNDAHYPILGISVLCIGFIICFFLAPGLNLLTHGEREARSLGLESRTYRFILYLLTSLFTATAVTMAGCIGFVGLVVPHLTRLLAGSDHRIVLPITVLLGGSLVALADTIARLIIPPQQLPVGIVMAMIGVPTFIWLLQK